MMKTIITENQRGFLFKNGRLVKLLDPGAYHTFGSSRIEVVNTNREVCSESCDLESLLQNAAIGAQTVAVEVSDEQLALHFVNGNFRECLTAGKYAFWSVSEKHTFLMADISVPEVSPEIPEYIMYHVSPRHYTKVTVEEYQKARLYYNKRFVRLLDAGTYYFWKNHIQVDAELVDTRLIQMDIVGQEVLTKDKVAVRINFVCHYRITDYVKIVTEIDDFKGQMHVAAQLALREYIGKYSIDEILDHKEQLSQYVYEKLKEKEGQFYIELADAGIRDIILPGEVREIMNTVLLAEKRAQANVITRREEVASTRSLLNTAKLMDENKTLYQLKELEYIERICENVGSIHVTGGGDLLTQLMSMVQKTKE